jgi:hypothetical protein
MTTTSLTTQTYSAIAPASVLAISAFAQAPQVSREQMKKDIQDRLHGPNSKLFDPFA